jgi:hypothetical protein
MPVSEKLPLFQSRERGPDLRLWHIMPRGPESSDYVRPGHALAGLYSLINVVRGRPNRGQR